MNLGNATIKGVLVSFSFGLMPGSKKDKNLTKEVCDMKDAIDGSGSWSNRLFPPKACGKRNAFTNLRGHLSTMRRLHYTNTYVFEDALWRILPEKRIEYYKDEIEMKGDIEAQQLLETLVIELPVLKEKARVGRGSAYRESDYPSPDGVREAFKYKVTFRPIPSAAALDPEVMADAIAELEELHQRRLRDANDALIRQFMEPMVTLADQLQNPEHRKIGSILTTITEFTSRIPQMDLTGNEQLLELAAKVNESFSLYTPEAIKEDEDTRRRLGSAVSTVIATLGNFGSMGKRNVV